MIIPENKKWGYVCVPRVASKSTSAWLKENGGIQTGGYHDAWVHNYIVEDEILDNMHIMLTTREPFWRITSLVRHLYYDSTWELWGKPNERSFESILAKLIKYAEMSKDEEKVNEALGAGSFIPNWGWTQSEFIRQSGANKIFVFEEFIKDPVRILTDEIRVADPDFAPKRGIKFGKSQERYEINPPPVPRSKEGLTKKQKSLILEYYEEDFDLLDYPKE